MVEIILLWRQSIYLNLRYRDPPFTDKYLTFNKSNLINLNIL